MKLFYLSARSSLERMKHQRQLQEAGMCGTVFFFTTFLLLSPTEADIMAYRVRKEKEEREKLFQQRKVKLRGVYSSLSHTSFLQDLEMLQQYQPWGKPAAGAPRVGKTPCSTVIIGCTTP